MQLSERVVNTETLFTAAQTRAVPSRATSFRISPPRPPVAILGVAFDNVTLPETVARIEKMIATRSPHYVVTANVDFLVQARRDAELRRILAGAHLMVCDGTPLVWASRFLGNPLPERVAGSDLVPELIRVAAEKNYRLFFLGATAEANEQAVANVRSRFPDLEIAHYSPPFRPWHEMDHDEIRKRIRQARPDILFVAFGCPKAEKWIEANHNLLGVPVTIGVGATIDFLAGRIKRAPMWMRRAGAEWVFRIWQEPRRLFKRYAADLWCFSRAMFAQWWRMKLREPRSRTDFFEGRLLPDPAWLGVQPPERLVFKAIRQNQEMWEHAGGSHVLLNLAGVKFMDSTGAALLVHLRRSLLASAHCLVLLSPSRAVLRTLRGMRLEELFLIAADTVKARALVEDEMRRWPLEAAA